MPEVNWTSEQQSKIEEAISAEIDNSQLAHKLIPEFNLARNDRAVSRDRYVYPNPAAMPPTRGMIDETFVPLVEREEQFSLTKLQVEEPDLTRALMRIRRAAQQLARQHDLLVFQTTIRDDLNRNAGVPGFHAVVDVAPPYSDNVVAAVSAAVALLDGEGYRTGFGMVAGQGIWTQMHTRAAGAADLPVKAVQALLEGGPIHRSAVLAADEALVISISGEEIDRAIAVPPTLEFLRIGANDERDFRLYERLLPRFKQTYSAVLLRLVAGAAPAAVAGP